MNVREISQVFQDGFPNELIALGFVAKNEGLHIQKMYYKEGGY